MLFAPAHHPTLIPVGPVSAIQCSDSAGNKKDNIDTDSNDSGVDTEIEWAEDAQLAELAWSVPSKVSEAMLIEVCQ